MLAVWNNIGKTMCKLAYFILNSMRQCFYHCVNTFEVAFSDGYVELLIYKKHSIK